MYKGIFNKGKRKKQIIYFKNKKYNMKFKKQ